MSHLWQDMRFGVQMLFKHPGFSAVAILTLALGVGATAALFTVVYAVFAPMPYPKPDQLGVKILMIFDCRFLIGLSLRRLADSIAEELNKGSVVNRQSTIINQQW